MYADEWTACGTWDSDCRILCCNVLHLMNSGAAIKITFLPTGRTKLLGLFCAFAAIRAVWYWRSKGVLWVIYCRYLNANYGIDPLGILSGSGRIPTRPSPLRRQAACSTYAYLR
jgi:hypothetical protein